MAKAYRKRRKWKLSDAGLPEKGWQGIDEAVRDKPRPGTGHHISPCVMAKAYRKGKVEAFLKLGCLKQGWQGVDEAVKDKPSTGHWSPIFPPCFVAKAYRKRQK
ncbi:hypothetical protein [Endozoicomonas sp. SCSIO W0465]|uniref:hypothetical protein n=1 Tax=Endozoicomonas sp. SCSIO W0465 TaxID=2918516 RepID=UPI002075E6EB|nr:hypothetical protein [Endozoicomonas sp. SCSIO W0465]USE34846.1 hypothetical protein MJO57_22345 [Endozoicomonas sp. SCSIO W0465]